MLDEAIQLAAEAGAHEVVMGMAHRGRLNVLAHTIGVPYEEILREFEGERTSEAVAADPERGSGDVKYHHGAAGTRTTEAGEITVTLAANPSHLEAVDPIVEGRTRAEQTDRSSGPGIHDPRVALPLLIHGDASFPGQGVVAETLNLQDLAGYTTGGTLHIIANNQVGFTTDPQEGRSTRYSSDLAKGFDIPIIHVNADDAEAAISAVRLALAFRSRFGEDVVVDLVGYRRHGHNEQDEPAYTQPLMAERIADHPSVREQFAAALVEQRAWSRRRRSTPRRRRVVDELRRAHEALKESFGKEVDEDARGAPAGGRRRDRDGRSGRAAAIIEPRADRASRRDSPSIRSWRASWSGGSRRWTRRPSTGGRPKRSHSPRCSSTASPSGSRDRTRSGGPSHTATSSSTMPRRASATRRSRI